MGVKHEKLQVAVLLISMVLYLQSNTDQILALVKLKNTYIVQNNLVTV